ncbi:Coenzyme F420 hydrogenase/dehydrogenase, beta subunit C-terminal domain [Sinomonas atrocyanea]|uniref:Coenzyme F420 hydrogenase/dehydrogenase, beta subunit C-terminal domain n=1 Tax=Sinomonas atrocyanea TaxID=37927 RepID=UPI0028556E60|nr:coenzyme F420 hydrogenase subunit beta [Sinomonas atrocyanea]
MVRVARRATCDGVPRPASRPRFIHRYCAASAGALASKRSPRMKTISDSALIASVVDNQNCSGCGLCASLFDSVRMELDEDGYLRPTIQGADARTSPDAQRVFRAACPGRVVTKPDHVAGVPEHRIFGQAFGAWESWALDNEAREAGSSAGVLTTLSSWIAQQNGGASRGAAMDSGNPRRTVPVQIVDKDTALAAAGSRYAPVAMAEKALHPDEAAVVGKPCEISALRSAHGPESPVLLSFFCAGTPSQRSTDALVSDLNTSGTDVTAVHYRGDGWPGKFRVRDRSGQTHSISYEQSWGDVLGRSLQTRCKICVDGTGESADISVGDYWHADARGYPIFSNSKGRSVAIARTKRGRDLMLRAAAEGILHLEPIDLDMVAKIQPLQTGRRTGLVGRLLGRIVQGYRVPHYVGYGLWRFPLRHPLWNVRSFLGTVRRARIFRSGKS